MYGAGVLRGARPALVLALLLASRAAAGPLWEDPAWLRLLHFKDGAGEARPGPFYLAPAGRTDPRAELEALRAALDAPPPSDGEPAYCRFPARTAWLAARDGRDAAALLAPCRRFADWAKLMDAENVTLVFASAYLNNPSSMFGHTFLRMERRGIGDGERLLDNTLNFAAETAETSGVLFAFRGLTGLYPGKYSASPFYMKAQEYGNIEFRDLWEYRLALSPAEVERLVAHAWEMGEADFPYFFFSKNCSYQLMPALEAAAPRLTLMPGSPPLVGPVDTVLEVVETPGLVRAVVYRPSHATTLRSRRTLLTRAERKAAKAFARGRVEAADAALERLPPERRALVLDAAQDLVLYEHGFSPDAPPEVRALERPILVRRGRLDAPGLDAPRPAWAAPPEEAHRRRRLMLGAGVRRGGVFNELAWRPGLHAFADRSRGYLPGNAIEGFAWRLRYDGETRRPYVRDLRVIDIVSLTPYDDWTRKPSWTTGTGLDTAFELGAGPADALVYDGHLASGLAAGNDSGTLVAAVLGAGEFAAGSVLRGGGRLGGGLRLMAGADVGRLRLTLEGALSGFALGDRRPNHRLKVGLDRALGRDRALRAEFLMRGPHREGMLNAVVYH
ncbi:MAG: DUF4105 domain-containing protein [Elusimicrobia bacterium]|nr:DUF4105 domain-containing protein [Elusimicrobiota bacterium]